MTTITKINLGENGPLVSKLGLGCMRMSSIWGGVTPDETECIATIHEALDSGINFLNTGDFYGAGHNEILIGKAIKGRRDDALVPTFVSSQTSIAIGFKDTNHCEMVYKANDRYIESRCKASSTDSVKFTRFCLLLSKIKSFRLLL